MTAAGRPQRDGLSIGAVLAQLRGEFPDVTISKIRFLESEGLVQPGRTPSGYRQFAAADVERLRFVLSAQRDHYLPLKVIKEQLDAADGGGEFAGPTQRLPRKLVALGSFDSGKADGSRSGMPGPDDFATEREIRLTQEELLREARIDAATLARSVAKLQETARQLKTEMAPEDWSQLATEIAAKLNGTDAMAVNGPRAADLLRSRGIDALRSLIRIEPAAPPAPRWATQRPGPRSAHRSRSAHRR